MGNHKSLIVQIRSPSFARRLEEINLQKLLEECRSMITDGQMKLKSCPVTKRMGTKNILFVSTTKKEILLLGEKMYKLENRLMHAFIVLLFEVILFEPGDKELQEEYVFILASVDCEIEPTANTVHVNKASTDNARRGVENTTRIIERQRGPKTAQNCGVEADASKN